jgi:hypothetical protein
LGYVEGPTEEAAIKEAIEWFGITDEERQGWVVAR